MLFSTLSIFTFAAISYITTLHIAVIYDIYDYSFLKDILVLGTHNLIIINPAPIRIFENFDEPIIYAPDKNNSNGSDTNFETNSETLPKYHIVYDTIAEIQEKYPLIYCIGMFICVLPIALFPTMLRGYVFGYFAVLSPTELPAELPAEPPTESPIEPTSSARTSVRHIPLVHPSMFLPPPQSPSGRPMTLLEQLAFGRPN